MSDLYRIKENSSAAAVGAGNIGSMAGGLGQVADTVKKSKKRRKVRGHVIIQRESRQIPPDIGAIVVPVEDVEKYREWEQSGGGNFPFGLHKYRVTGWYCPRKPPARTGGFMDELTQMMWDTADETDKMKPCSRKDATHIDASGVSGLFRPIDQVAVVGRVNWSPEEIAQEKADWNHTVAHDDGF